MMLRAIDEGRRIGVVLLTGDDGYPKAVALAKTAEPQLAPADFLRRAASASGTPPTRCPGPVPGRRAPGELVSLGFADSGFGAEARKEMPYRQSFKGKQETCGAVI